MELSSKIQTVKIEGSGPDPWLVALVVKRHLPQLEVEVHDRGGPVDPIGETTTPYFTRQLLGPLGIRPIDLHRLARPVWTLGFRCRWGRREEFHRAFDLNPVGLLPGTDCGMGFLAARADFTGASVGQALMQARRMPSIDPGRGSGPVDAMAGLQLDPERFGAMLRKACEVVGVRSGTEDSIADLRIETERGEGDFVDAPFASRRAVTGTRHRASESIRPYAGLETHASGWWWRVEHDDRIGLGFAFDPDELSDEEARKILADRLGDPVGDLRIHEWRCGHRVQPWSEGSLLVGDAAGRFEPMTGMRLPLLLHEAQTFCRIVGEANGEPGEACRALYNGALVRGRREIGDFISLHYRHAGRDEAFWKRAGERAAYGGMKRLIDLYGTTGPSGYILNAIPGFPGTMGGESWIAAMVGLGLPFQADFEPSPEAGKAWEAAVAENERRARQGSEPERALAAAR